MFAARNEIPDDGYDSSEDLRLRELFGLPADLDDAPHEGPWSEVPQFDGAAKAQTPPDVRARESPGGSEESEDTEQLQVLEERVESPRLDTAAMYRAARKDAPVAEPLERGKLIYSQVAKVRYFDEAGVARGAEEIYERNFKDIEVKPPHGFRGTAMVECAVVGFNPETFELTRRVETFREAITCDHAVLYVLRRGMASSVGHVPYSPDTRDIKSNSPLLGVEGIAELQKRLVCEMWGRLFGGRQTGIPISYVAEALLVVHFFKDLVTKVDVPTEHYLVPTALLSYSALSACKTFQVHVSHLRAAAERFAPNLKNLFACDMLRYCDGEGRSIRKRERDVAASKSPAFIRIPRDLYVWAANILRNL